MVFNEYAVLQKYFLDALFRLPFLSKAFLPISSVCFPTICTFKFWFPWILLMFCSVLFIVFHIHRLFMTLILSMPNGLAVFILRNIIFLWLYFNIDYLSFYYYLTGANLWRTRVVLVHSLFMSFMFNFFFIFIYDTLAESHSSVRSLLI